MTTSSQKDLSVCNFDEEEAAVEALSGKFRSRFDSKLPKTDDAVDKYFFLQAYTSEGNLALSEEKSESDEITLSSPNSREHGQICQDEFEPGTLARTDSLVMGASSLVVPSFGDKQFSEPPSDGTPVDVISDGEENWASDSRSPSTSASDLSENEGLLGRPILYYTAFGETYDDDMAVIVSPDHLFYGKTLYGESQLTFFSDCIKMECSDASGNDEKFLLERVIADIIHIDCQQSGSAEVAIVKLCLSATAVAGTKKVFDNSDIVTLIFSVTGIQWLDKEQKIKSLAARYKDIWNVYSNDDLVLEDDVVEPNMFFSKHHFTQIEEPFEDVIYPKGDPDAVSISKRDIELLQPDTFINDTIIDFYIKFLKNKIQPVEKPRFHFFNSFFFRKLADLDKDPGSALEGRAAFKRVHKWTRKVNIFEKDYIFIPVNFNLHWSLLVICHPGEVATLKDVDIKESPKVPCILHMDSIKGSHSGLRTLIQSYLLEEWKERHPESPEDNLSKFSNLRFVPLELPQQENSFDCGLFLLHYVELFLEKAPANFSLFKVSKFSSFLTADWFLPAEASLKRSLIRKLIYDLLKDPSHLSLGYPEKDIKQETALDFISENCSAAKAVFDDSAHSVSDGRIEIKLLTTSPTVAQCDKQGLVLREFLAPRATAESSSECMDHPSQKDAPSQKLICTRCPMEEYADTSEQFVSTELDKDDCQPMDVSRSEQICSTSCAPKDAGRCEGLWSSMQKKEEFSMDSSLEPLNSDLAVSNQKDETQKPLSSLENHGFVPESPTTSYGEKLDSCVEDSQEIDTAKAEGGDCEDFQGVDTTEADCGDDEDCRDINASQSEGGGGENCQDIHTNKAERVHGEDCQNIETTKVNVEDCQEIDTTEAEGGDGERQETADTGSGGNSDPCRTPSLPAPSCRDIVSSDDESSLDRDDALLGKRDEPGERLEQQPLKRQKHMLPEGCRRHTRSRARNCLP